MKNYWSIFIVAITISITACTDEPTTITGDDRNQFTGSWTCTENSKVFGNSVYSVTITNIGAGDSVSIRNFYNLGNSYYGLGLVSGKGITIPFQSIDGTIVQGSGLLLNSNKFELDYFTNDAGVKDTVFDSFSR